MQTFTMTQLTQETGLVADIADREPVTITRHSRPRYVMLRVDEYERIMAHHQDPRRVLSTNETPADIQALLADELAALDGKKP